MSQSIKIFLLASCLILHSCVKKKETVDIKLLLLNPENYLNQTLSIQGKVKDIGPLNLWFILEDDSGYIQVSTQNIAEKTACLKKDNYVTAYGQLEQYSIHKYFNIIENLKCAH